MDRNILNWIHFPGRIFFSRHPYHYFLKEHAEAENRNKGDPIRNWQVDTLVEARVSKKTYQPESIAAAISSRHMSYLDSPSKEHLGITGFRASIEEGT